MAFKPFRFLREVLGLVVGAQDELGEVLDTVRETGDRIEEAVRDVRSAVCGDGDERIESLATEISNLRADVGTVNDTLSSLTIKQGELARAVEELATRPPGQ